MKYINKFINSCRICNENKYDRNPYRKHFNHTVTPERPNMIVHMDIFQIHGTYFLTTIDRFTKLGSVHKITDKNMCTVRVKIQERIALLGKPELLIMDNEFNNALIRLFCAERNVQTHFTTAYSHTGNSDIERMHLSLLEHIRILKRSNENVDVEELVVGAIGFYNGTIHSTTNMKPIDLLSRSDIDHRKVARYMGDRKRKAINRVNSRRGKVPNYDNRELYMKNPGAQRQKTAKGFVKCNADNPNKMDLANVKRPLKTFSGNGNVDHPGTSAVLVGPMH
ncbi:Retrovirus-related Pol polyprotein from transposon opus [Lucilia cuprina]|nr:Retrovirus-related Pol polyprotein from transposon opus [Lucilia cuprina]